MLEGDRRETGTRQQFVGGSGYSKKAKSKKQKAKSEKANSKKQKAKRYRKLCGDTKKWRE